VAFVREETHEERRARFTEQQRGFRRVFARTRDPRAVKLVFEAVLIFLAIAGSALAATTWDAMFGDGDLTEAETESSSPTDSAPRHSTTTTAEPTTSLATDSTKSSDPPQLVDFSEVAGRYRLVFIVASGPCSADPEDNPPLDVTVTEISRSSDPERPGKVTLDIREAGGSSGSYDVELTRFRDPRGPDDDDLELKWYSEDGTLSGAFYKHADGVSLAIYLSAVGCRFSYAGPWIGP
jgi:hypothetical protein